MEKLKNLIATLIIITLVAASAGISIAASEVIDPDDEITISESLNEQGQGSVEIARNVTGYKLYAQAKVLDNDTYKQIKQLKDELTVIKYYNLYVATNSKQDQDNYESAQAYYKNLYGANVTDCTDSRVDTIISTINSTLLEKAHYDANKWMQLTDNTFKLEPSEFSGTADFAVWVKLQKQDGTEVYDAETYELTGTKQNSDSKNENTTDNNNTNNNTDNTKKSIILDPDDEIKIYDYLTDGKGQIDIARNVKGYKLYVQAVELDNDTYKQIKQLKDELTVISDYNLYIASNSQQDKDTYESAQAYYKNLYGTNVTNCTDERVDEAISQINSLLLQKAHYSENANDWLQTTDNTFYLDPSVFTGTKDIAVWAKLQKQDGTEVYDAEVYELTGTKKSDEKPENNNTTENNVVENNTTNNNTIENSTTNNNTVENNTINNNTVDNNTINNNTTENNTVNNNAENNTVNNNTENNTTDNNKTNENKSNNSNGEKSDNSNNSSSNQLKSENSNNGSSTSSKSTPSTTTSTTSTSKIPYAGSAEVIQVTVLISIVAAIVAAVVCLIKYNKIK